MKNSIRADPFWPVRVGLRSSRSTFTPDPCCPFSITFNYIFLFTSDQGPSYPDYWRHTSKNVCALYYNFNLLNCYHLSRRNFTFQSLQVIKKKRKIDKRHYFKFFASVREAMMVLESSVTKEGFCLWFFNILPFQDFCWEENYTIFPCSYVTSVQVDWHLVKKIHDKARCSFWGKASTLQNISPVLISAKMKK